MRTSGCLLLAALMTAPAMAQFELIIAKDGTLIPALPSVDAGAVALGDRADILLRLRNSTSSLATLDLLAVQGPGFRLQGEPTLPVSLGPGQMQGFRVVFQPTVAGPAKATLRYPGGSTEFTGTGYASLTITATDATGQRTLQAADRVNFGSVDPGKTASLPFLLTNSNATGQILESLDIQGPSFDLVDTPRLPLTIAPAQAVAFSVRLNGEGSGVVSGTLSINGRKIGLDGFIHTPEPPEPRIEVSDGPWKSAQNVPIRVRFAAAALGAGKGEIRLQFVPLNTITQDDAAIQFAAGGRLLEFTFEKGDTEARFAGGPGLAVQTGTTAGLIILIAHVEEKQSRVERTIDPAPVAIAGVTTAREAAALTVRFTGYDNSRTSTRIRYTFYDGSGTVIPPGEIPVEARDPFRDFFTRGSTVGAFSVDARFPVTGDLSIVRSVEIEVESLIGRSAKARASF